MFEIDDNFLTSVGYDVTTLSDAKKRQYKDELSEELNQRIIQSMMSEIDESQANEMSDIQENPDRARAWLHEFHSDYRTRDDFRQLAAAMSEDELVTFYATSLWFKDAIPGFGEIVQDEFDKYQSELIATRQMVNSSLEG